jgi:voltage-gated potassium channel
LITSVDNNNGIEEEYELQLYQITEGDDFYDSDTDFGYAFDYIYLDGNHGRDYEYQCMPVAISKRLNGSKSLTEDREIDILPSDDTPVEAGDYLILIAKGTWMDELEDDFSNPQGLNPNDQGKVDWTRLSLFQGDQDGSYATDSNEDRNDTTSDRSFHDHIVIIGWDQVSKIITRRLRASDREVVVVADQESDVRTVEEMFPEPEVTAEFSTLSNYSVLDERPINITRSNRVFVNRSEDDESLVTIMNLEERYGVTPVEGDDNLSVVAAISDVDLEQSFKTAGVTYTVSHDVINAKLITSYLYEEDVAFVAEDFLYGTQNEEDADLQQYRVNSDSACLGSTYLETLKEVKEKYDCLTIGIAQDKMGHKLQKLPKEPDTIQVEQGDYLLFIVKEKYETDLVDYMGTEEGH